MDWILFKPIQTVLSFVTRTEPIQATFSSKFTEKIL